MEQTLSLVHTSDLHLGNPFAFLPEHKAQKMRREQEKALISICSFCRREEIPFLFVTGDLFDSTNPPLDLIQRTADAFRICSDTHVVIAAGNHDPVRDNCFWTNTDWPENVIVPDPETASLYFEDYNLRVYTAAFTTQSSEAPILDTLEPEPNASSINLLHLHGDVVQGGGNSRYNPIPRGWLEDSGLDLALLGHIHRAMIKGNEVKNKTPWIYPGCPMGRGFDEDGEKGFYLIKISKNLRSVGNSSEVSRLISQYRHEMTRAEIEFNFQALNAPRFHKVKYNLSGIELDYQEALAQAIVKEMERSALNTGSLGVDKDLYRISLCGESNLRPNIAILSHLLEENLFYIELTDESLPQFRDERSSREQSLRGRMARLCRPYIDNPETAPWQEFPCDLSDFSAEERGRIMQEALRVIYLACETEVLFPEDS